MLKKCVWTVALACCVLGVASGDTLELKDKAAVTGKILSEKRDLVAIDVGYTVLVVPRNQIVKISKTEAVPGSVKPAGLVKATEPEAPQPASRGGFYTDSKKALPASTVR